MSKETRIRRKRRRLLRRGARIRMAALLAAIGWRGPLPQKPEGRV